MHLPHVEEAAKRLVARAKKSLSGQNQSTRTQVLSNVAVQSSGK